MLDIKFIRNNPDIVVENCKKRFCDEKLVGQLLSNDKEYLDLLKKSQELIKIP